MKLALTTLFLVFSLSSFASEDIESCDLQLNLKSALSVSKSIERKLKSKLKEKGFTDIDVRRSGYELDTGKIYVLDLIIDKWGDYSSVFMFADGTPIEQTSGSDIVTNPKDVLLLLVDELSFDCNK